MRDPGSVQELDRTEGCSIGPGQYAIGAVEMIFQPITSGRCGSAKSPLKLHGMRAHGAADKQWRVGQVVSNMRRGRENALPIDVEQQTTAGMGQSTVLQSVNGPNGGLQFRDRTGCALLDPRLG